jgi:hypothetical protein
VTETTIVIKLDPCQHIIDEQSDQAIDSPVWTPRGSLCNRETIEKIIEACGKDYQGNRLSRMDLIPDDQLKTMIKEQKQCMSEANDIMKKNKNIGEGVNKQELVDKQNKKLTELQAAHNQLEEKIGKWVEAQRPLKIKEHETKQIDKENRMEEKKRQLENQLHKDKLEQEQKEKQEKE